MNKQKKKNVCHTAINEVRKLQLLLLIIRDISLSVCVCERQTDRDREHTPWPRGSVVAPPPSVTRRTNGKVGQSHRPWCKRSVMGSCPPPWTTFTAPPTYPHPYDGTTKIYNAQTLKTKLPTSSVLFHEFVHRDGVIPHYPTAHFCNKIIGCLSSLLALALGKIRKSWTWNLKQEIKESIQEPLQRV